VSGLPLESCAAMEVGNPPPRGPSLLSKLCCLGSSSLHRPHPPHPQAHCNFTARRLIRSAFAVRERLGDPRVVPGFRWPFLLGMPLSMTPGARSSYGPERSMPTSPSPRSERLGTPSLSAIRFPRGTSFGASRFTHLLRPAKLLAPLHGSDRYVQPSGALLPGFQRISHPPRCWI
jgi:hypothetical protein